MLKCYSILHSPESVQQVHWARSGFTAATPISAHTERFAAVHTER